MRVHLQEHCTHTVNELTDLRVMTANLFLWTQGCHNHKGNSGDALHALFDHIASVAPGSYGVLYVLDDEEPVEPGLTYVRTYVLVRGTFSERTDAYLSPFVPVVEDPYSAS